MSNSQIPKNIRELAKKRAAQFESIMLSTQPKNYVVGQIWSTKNQITLGDNRIFHSDEPRIVVILDSDEFNLVVAPISIETQMAGEYDFLVRGDDSPLNFDFHIETWNEIPVVTKQLNHCLGSLNKYLVEMLRELHGAYLLDIEVTEDLRPYVGVFIFEQDSRLEFQEEEVKAVRYLSQAATYSLTISKTVERIVQKQTIDFGIPIWSKLSDFRNQSMTSVAAAAGYENDLQQEAYLIFHGKSPNKTIMQLNVSKRDHAVYLIVLQLSQQLQNQRAIISLTINDTKLYSDETELVVDTHIHLGIFKGFKQENVEESIEVELV